MTQFSVSLDKIAQQLKLEVVYTPKELKDIPIYTADVNRPGLLLTGYDEYFDPTRIQYTAMQRWVTSAHCRRPSGAAACIRCLPPSRPPWW